MLLSFCCGLMVLSFRLAKDPVGDKQWTSLALSDIEVMNRKYSLRRTLVEQGYALDGEDRNSFAIKFQR